VLINNLKLFTGVVVVNSDLRVIGSYYYPLLPCHELSTSHRTVGDFEGTDLCLLVVIKDSNVACIESNEHPRKSRVQLDRLDSL
jgi:hypothetical protein